MFIRHHPVLHFVIAVLLAVAAALITAAGPLLVLSTSFGLSPAVALQWHAHHGASDPATAGSAPTPN